MIAAASLASAPTLRAQSASVVELGIIDLSIHEGVGEIVAQTLRRLGHEVSTKRGAHDKIYPLLATGEIDLLAAAWLPHAHGAYWKQYEAVTTKAATLYEKAQLYWGVPGYVSADVAAIGDLAKPEIAKRFEQEILNLGATSGLTQRSRTAMTAYGLDSAGFKATVVDAATRQRRLDAAFASRQPFVVPCSSVQWLNKVFQLRPLADPQDVLGGADDAVLIARRQSHSKLPDRSRSALSRIRLNVADVVNLDHAIAVAGQPAVVAADAWMRQHSDIVDSWLER